MTDIILKEGKLFSFHSHFRIYDENLAKGKNVEGLSAKGGCTVAVLGDRGGFRWGVARCSHKEVFCKRVGRAMSYQRAQGPRAAVSAPIKNMVDVRNLAMAFAIASMKKRPLDIGVIEGYMISNPKFDKISEQLSLIK